MGFDPARHARAALWLAVAVLIGWSSAGDAAARQKPNRRVSEAAEYAPYDSAGTGAISGTGVASPEPGTRLSIARCPVILRPATSWAQGWWERTVLRRGSWHAPDALAESHLRRTVADSTGHFRFQGLPAGRYFVLSSTTWGSEQTQMHQADAVVIYLGKAVTVGPGEHVSVALDSLLEDRANGSSNDEPTEWPPVPEGPH